MNQKNFNTQSLQLTTSANLSDGIKVIDSSHVQIAFVVDENKCLVGTITDGDIRRALLRGEPLNAPVERVMFRGFHALPMNTTEEEAVTLMRSKSLRQIPTLDEHGRIVGLFLLEELISSKKRPNSVIIMAGGKGERLQPLTQDSPKPMLRVGGKPLLEINLEQCINAGFEHFYFSVNYLKDQIINYFGDGSRWHVHIDYLEEMQPLGTGGALSLLPKKPTEPFLVVNSDVLTRVDYGRLLQFHDEHRAAATLCVRKHRTQIPYGVVHMNDLNVLSIEEKPVLDHYVNAGIYFLDPVLLDLVPQDSFFDMPTLLERALQDKHRIGAFPIHEYWLDVGLPETLKRAHREWV